YRLGLDGVDPCDARVRTRAAKDPAHEHAWNVDVAGVLRAAGHALDRVDVRRALADDVQSTTWCCALLSHGDPPTPASGAMPPSLIRESSCRRRTGTCFRSARDAPGLPSDSTSCRGTLSCSSSALACRSRTESRCVRETPVGSGAACRRRR